MMERILRILRGIEFERNQAETRIGSHDLARKGRGASLKRGTMSSRASHPVRVPDGIVMQRRKEPRGRHAVLPPW